MARKTKIYKVICSTSYNGINRQYTAFQSHYKRECNNYLKDRCYQTVSRTYYIDEDYVYLD